MPSAFAYSLLHQIQIGVGCRSFLPFVPSLIAGPTSSDDILCRIEATVLPRLKVLSGALERFRL
jgi:hypothetical protein